MCQIFSSLFQFNHLGKILMNTIDEIDHLNLVIGRYFSQLWNTGSIQTWSPWTIHSSLLWFSSCSIVSQCWLCINWCWCISLHCWFTWLLWFCTRISITSRSCTSSFASSSSIDAFSLSVCFLHYLGYGWWTCCGNVHGTLRRWMGYEITQYIKTTNTNLQLHHSTEIWIRSRYCSETSKEKESFLIDSNREIWLVCFLLGNSLLVVVLMVPEIFITISIINSSAIVYRHPVVLDCSVVPVWKRIRTV